MGQVKSDRVPSMLYCDFIMMMEIKHLQFLFIFPFFKQLFTVNVVWILEILEHLHVCNLVTSAQILVSEDILFELLEAAKVRPQVTDVFFYFCLLISFNFRGFLLAFLLP